MRFTKTEQFTYDQGDVKLDFSLNCQKNAEDFLVLLKQAVIDVEKMVENGKAK